MTVCRRCMTKTALRLFDFCNFIFSVFIREFRMALEQTSLESSLCSPAADYHYIWWRFQFFCVYILRASASQPASPFNFNHHNFWIFFVGALPSFLLMRTIQSSNARCEVNYRNSGSKNTVLMNKMASHFCDFFFFNVCFMWCLHFFSLALSLSFIRQYFISFRFSFFANSGS